MSLSIYTDEQNIAYLNYTLPRKRRSNIQFHIVLKKGVGIDFCRLYTLVCLSTPSRQSVWGVVDSVWKRFRCRQAHNRCPHHCTYILTWPFALMTDLLSGQLPTERSAAPMRHRLHHYY